MYLFSHLYFNFTPTKTHSHSPQCFYVLQNMAEIKSCVQRASHVSGDYQSPCPIMLPAGSEQPLAWYCICFQNRFSLSARQSTVNSLWKCQFLSTEHQRQQWLTCLQIIPKLEQGGQKMSSWNRHFCFFCFCFFDTNFQPCYELRGKRKMTKGKSRDESEQTNRCDSMAGYYSYFIERQKVLHAHEAKSKMTKLYTYSRYYWYSKTLFIFKY